MRTYACGLAALVLLAGCSTPYRPPQFLEPGASFPGLIDFVAEADKKSGKQEADVLLVHGMCTHDATWATETVNTLAAQLAANVLPSASRSGGSGIITIPDIIHTPRGKLLVKSLIWSPLTTPIKQQLCYDQTDKSPICLGMPAFPGKRASLNAKAKDGLLDDCLPDALIYQGDARFEIQRRMREAIMNATENADPNTPLIVISESLGSKILFDTLAGMIEDKDQRAAQAARRDLERMAYLIMAANQIPLLQTAQQIPAPGDRQTMQAPPPDSLQLLLKKREDFSKDRRGPAIDALTLIAFTDPNDLLSYTLPPERYPGAIVHNVLVSNDRTYLGLFENPVKAHLDYLSNPDVGSLISCGQPRSALCK
ncbi:hypothetical protein GCM10007388_46610 [Pseudoduganella plicata]|nr:hypothetical protein GCM10007388_46610 [Pseudoduganella plicata]